MSTLVILREVFCQQKRNAEKEKRQTPGKMMENNKKKSLEWEEGRNETAQNKTEPNEMEEKEKSEKRKKEKKWFESKPFREFQDENLSYFSIIKSMWWVINKELNNY